MERIQCPEKALQACRLALNVLLKTLLAFLLLLPLQLLVYWKLFPADWAGVVLQQDEALLKQQNSVMKLAHTSIHCMQ